MGSCYATKRPSGYQHKMRLQEQTCRIRTSHKKQSKNGCTRLQQEEGIDFDETYAPIARIKFIHILLAYSCFMNFKLYQIDVKSTFLNEFLKETIYVEQPPGF